MRLWRLEGLELEIDVPGPIGSCISCVLCGEMCLFVCMHVYLYVCMYVHIFVCMYNYVRVIMYVCM